MKKKNEVDTRNETLHDETEDRSELDNFELPTLLSKSATQSKF